MTKNRPPPNKCGTKWLPWQRRLPRHGPRILKFMAAYFKKAKVYKFPNTKLYSVRAPSHVIKFWGSIGQRSRSHWHIMYKAKMCLNSVLGDSWVVTSEPTHKLLAIATPIALPRAKNYVLYRGRSRNLREGGRTLPFPSSPLLLSLRSRAPYRR